MSFAEDSKNTYFTKTDLLGNYTYVSPLFIEIFNLQPDDIYGTSSLDTIYFEDHAICFETVQKCFMNPKTYQKVIMRKPVDAEKIIWTKWEFYLDTDNDGNPLEMLCYGQNITDLIELKQLVKDYSVQFKENETKFKTLFETSSLFIVLHTAKGKILEANQVFCDHIGVSKDLISKHNLLKFTEAKNHKEFKSFINKKIVGLGEISLETEITSKDGLITPVSINPRAFHNEKGEIFIWTIAKDITERKEQKQQLENQTEFLEQTANIAKLGGWEINLDSFRTEWSKEVYKIHDLEVGYDHNLENGISFYHPDDQDRVAGAVNNTINNGTPFDLECRFISAKKINKQVKVSGRAVYKNNIITSVKGVIQDISERKLAEETIDKQNQLLLNQKELLEQTAVIAKLGGWVINLDPFKREWTKEVYTIFDLDPEITNNIDHSMEFYHPDDQAILTKAQSLCIKEGTSYDLELRLISAKKTSKWVRVMGKADYSNNKIKSIRGIVQDITEKKNVEETLKKQNDLVKDLFFAQSHLIRLPVANIIGLTDLLEITNQQDEKNEILSKIKHSVNQLDKIIKKVANKKIPD